MYFLKPEVNAPHPTIATFWFEYSSGSALAAGKQTGEMASE